MTARTIRGVSIFYDVLDWSEQWKRAFNSMAFEVRHPPLTAVTEALISSVPGAHFALAARCTYDDVEIRCIVREGWRVGSPPDPRHPSRQGFYLWRASWHAEIGDRGGFDLHLDPKKEDSTLLVHTHPFPARKDHRVARERLGTPLQWLDEVLEIARTSRP